ncbi:uncharacterized protein LOC110990539 [Acanthaster planci]|uniref:Uncharacterized protein LOC110990539 n=1 Tax=Acanthaster planci TaxID=133434 RepID=A0A8B8A1P4_ACAPL|nr:uncharacterized protein LOC110990539 [Acanthaster planci]
MGCGSSNTSTGPVGELEKPPRPSAFQDVSGDDRQRENHGGKTSGDVEDGGTGRTDQSATRPAPLLQTGISLSENGKVGVSNPLESRTVGEREQKSGLGRHPAVGINTTDSASLKKRDAYTENTSHLLPTNRGKQGGSYPRLKPTEEKLGTGSDHSTPPESQECHGTDSPSMPPNEDQIPRPEAEETEGGGYINNFNEIIDEPLTGTGNESDPKQTESTSSKPAAVTVSENFTQVNLTSDEIDLPGPQDPWQQDNEVLLNDTAPVIEENAGNLNSLIATKLDVPRSEPRPREIAPSDVVTEYDSRDNNANLTSHNNSSNSKHTPSVDLKTITKETQGVIPEDGAEPPSLPPLQESILDRVRGEALETHNIYRARHGVPPLVLNDQINAYSQKWAEKMASTRKFEHSPSKSRSNYGENIYYSGSTHFSVHEVKGGTSITAFYNEIKDYDYKRPGERKRNGGQIGHFTQVIWKDSKELGVGMTTTKKGDMGYVYVCCNYGPPGNVIGRFEQNVPLPITDGPIAPKMTSRDGGENVAGQSSNRSADGAGAPPLPSGKETPLQRVRREMLWAHNVSRGKHDLAPLTLDAKLNKHAQQWATKMANTKKFELSPRGDRPGYGENIFMAGSYNFDISNVKGVEVAAFFCDETAKDGNMGRFTNRWNAISTCTTELAWKTSQQLGVGMATTKKGKMEYVYVCCSYS